MTKQFMKKEGLAISQLALALIGEQPGSRLKTIEEFATLFSLSVGVIQQALKVLEEKQHIVLERRGCHGTMIKSINIEGLFSESHISNIVCVMPLPYTKLYEGLASGLKRQFNQIALYFAHMRGANDRMTCLINGVYDMAVVSRLAAQSFLHHDLVEIALSLGEHSYVSGHQLIYRKGEYNHITQVGLDTRSPDQRLLTEHYFANRPIEQVNISYDKGLEFIRKGNIDAMIWNIGDRQLAKPLTRRLLQDQMIYRQATEAVILVKKDNFLMKQLIKHLVEVPLLINHQQAVVAGSVDPCY